MYNLHAVELSESCLAFPCETSLAEDKYIINGGKICYQGGYHVEIMRLFRRTVNVKDGNDLKRNWESCNLGSNVASRGEREWCFLFFVYNL